MIHTTRGVKQLVSFLQTSPLDMSALGLLHLGEAGHQPFLTTPGLCSTLVLLRMLLLCCMLCHLGETLPVVPVRCFTLEIEHQGGPSQ